MALEELAVAEVVRAVVVVETGTVVLQVLHLMEMVDYRVVAVVAVPTVEVIVQLGLAAVFVSCGPVQLAHSHQLVQAHLNF